MCEECVQVHPCILLTLQVVGNKGRKGGPAARCATAWRIFKLGFRILAVGIRSRSDELRDRIRLRILAVGIRSRSDELRLVYRGSTQLSECRGV